MKVRSPSSSIPKKPSDHTPRVAAKKWSCDECLRKLRSLGQRKNMEGMARFGIVAKQVLGVAKPRLNELAKRIGRDHALALPLWETGVHDARMLAGMIDDPQQVSSSQMDRWVRGFDNWDVCDGTCCHLFVFAPQAWPKTMEWTARRAEFEKRAGFALIAYLAYRDKTASNAKFLASLRLIERECEDQRHFVKKAVNWALRNIGKRNLVLNRAALRVANRIRKRDSSAARWIAADALRELCSTAILRRLRGKNV
jgi:3-methyladenine DNA glycosylase AlkD